MMGATSMEVTRWWTTAHASISKGGAHTRARLTTCVGHKSSLPSAVRLG